MPSLLADAGAAEVGGAFFDWDFSGILMRDTKLSGTAI